METLLEAFPRAPLAERHSVWIVWILESTQFIIFYTCLYIFRPDEARRQCKMDRVPNVILGQCCNALNAGTSSGLLDYDGMPKACKAILVKRSIADLYVFCF